MKNIKTLLVGAILLSATSMQAQKQIIVKPTVQKVERKVFKLDTPEARAKYQTQQMTTMLDLTEAQVARVSILNLKVENKIEVIRNSRMMEEKKKEFIQGNLNDRMSALKSLLTKDQFNEYSASLKK